MPALAIKLALWAAGGLGLGLAVNGSDATRNLAEAARWAAVGIAAYGAVQWLRK